MLVSVVGGGPILQIVSSLLVLVSRTWLFVFILFLLVLVSRTLLLLLVVGCWLLVVVAVAVVLSKPNTHEHIYLHNMTSIEM